MPSVRRGPLKRSRFGSRGSAPGIAGDVDSALAALAADDLRAVVRQLLLELDDRAHAHAVAAILRRAADAGSGWAPAALGDADVTDAIAFVDAARRIGSADPGDVDAHLLRGTAAFLHKNYHTAHRILGALLRLIAEGEIDLGEHEVVDEVLGCDPRECSMQYIVATYMVADPSRRAEDVRAALDEVGAGRGLWEPIRQMERTAVEPLPDLATFLLHWRAVLAEEVDSGRCGGDADRWLREVVQRLEGAEGLARVARSTRRYADLRAWCDALVEARDWRSALTAFEEAAGLVADWDYGRGVFLDGAALAVQESDGTDLALRLEFAWRSQPTLPRLCRWLGSAGAGDRCRERAVAALDACPPNAARQRALLLVMSGEIAAAAKLLAEAPGLGWSAEDHPGHLLFPVFQALLGGAGIDTRGAGASMSEMDCDGVSFALAGRDGPRLATPAVGALLHQAGMDTIAEAREREVALAAMRTAAEKRVAGVTEEKRRRHYGHAAALVAACVANDPSPGTARWASALREAYRRFPALRAELDRCFSIEPVAGSGLET